MSDETKQVAEKALAVPEQAKALTIIDVSDYQKAAELLKVVKTIRKEIEDTFKPMKRKLDEAKKEILEQERKADAPLVEAENILKPKMAKFVKDEEVRRREEERRKQEEVRRQEEERRLAEAVAAEQAGDNQAANALLEEPVYVPPVIEPKKDGLKVAGVATVTVWKFRVTDENKIPRKYLKIDEQAIGQVVRALKDKAEIPGVEVYSEDGIRAGRM